MEQDLVIDPEGWLVAAERHESPHYNERPDEDAEPHVVVLHNISLPPNRFGTGLVRDLFMGELDTKTHPIWQTSKGCGFRVTFLLRATDASSSS